MKTERIPSRRGERAPKSERGLQQRKGSNHIGPHKFAGSIDRAIDVAFRRQMHDDLGPEAFKDIAHLRGVGNVSANEGKARIGGDGAQGFEISRVSQLVDDENRMLRAPDDLPRHGRPDKSRAAGDQNASLFRH